MPRRPLHPIEMLVAAKRAGYSCDEIARALGVVKNAVNRRLRELGEAQTERPQLNIETWFETIRDWAVSVAEDAEDMRRAVFPDTFTCEKEE